MTSNFNRSFLLGAWNLPVPTHFNIRIIEVRMHLKLVSYIGSNTYCFYILNFTYQKCTSSPQDTKMNQFKSSILNPVCFHPDDQWLCFCLGFELIMSLLFILSTSSTFLAFPPSSVYLSAFIENYFSEFSFHTEGLKKATWFIKGGWKLLRTM